MVAPAWQLAGATCQLRARRPPARLPGPSASRAVLGAAQLAAQSSIQHGRRRGGPRRAPEGRSKAGCAATAGGWAGCPCHEALAACCSARSAPAAAAGQELRFAPLTWSNGGAGECLWCGGCSSVRQEQREWAFRAGAALQARGSLMQGAKRKSRAAQPRSAFPATRVPPRHRSAPP